MSFEAFETHWPENVAGKFYVGDQCLNSYVKKQPETSDELARCREALAGCCIETIYEDGDTFVDKSNVAA
jgi:ferredoxin